ncbi:hypothetical protein [Paramaledivibacter caminithermalis]|jgi:hypothetical protein|uniref:Uncharacterized protein n=1 Tax=Paramaledivibacter caminithermalis (strain DSM 15212 / CIP 107654 / DViRD3) TaxID=1121301 RepID=A0A1M6Q7B0_PARC5|nr:hypothetical protein [Paramaledivibacter caminithermalis]SHK16142.1 hypothetical protein SAMN02745912_02451 [Paramaledivibacter caminithermalis DSM 15212]
MKNPKKVCNKNLIKPKFKVLKPNAICTTKRVNGLCQDQPC